MTEELMRKFYMAGFRRAGIMYAPLATLNKGVAPEARDDEIEENGKIMWEANKERLIKAWCPMERELDEFNPLKILLESGKTK